MQNTSRDQEPLQSSGNTVSGQHPPYEADIGETSPDGSGDLHASGKGKGATKHGFKS